MHQEILLLECWNDFYCAWLVYINAVNKLVNSTSVKCDKINKIDIMTNLNQREKSNITNTNEQFVLGAEENSIILNDDFKKR